MISQPFDYFAPATINEAVKLLRKHGSGAKVIAGGQSLVPLMNLGLASPRTIIDISQLKRDDLSYIRESKERLSIGALTTHYEIETSPLVRKRTPILCEAVSTIADVQVRNRGTIGGAVCHADPAGDYLPPLVALGAGFRARGPNGKVRTIDGDHFFVDLFTTALKANEILTEVRVPKQPQNNAGSAYLKHMYVEGGFAIVGAAAVVSTDRKGVCDHVKVVLGGVIPVPLVLTRVEKSLRGQVIGENAIEEAGQIAFDAATKPLSDIHADAEYRREMARVFTKRALARAVSRSRGKGA
jgi:carbon-monoxide dehydrogenase medium subunit